MFSAGRIIFASLLLGVCATAAQQSQNQQGPATSRNDLPALTASFSFVTVPVTVKDGSGRLLKGLTPADFTIYEDGVPQKMTFFSSDPFPLSAAVVVDTNLPAKTLDKVNSTLPALVNAFSQFDEVALFRYGNTVQEVSGFAASGSISDASLEKLKRSARNQGAPVVPPAGAGSHPADSGAPPVYSSPPEATVLNDAVLRGAQELSKRRGDRRRIILVISDGKENASSAHFEEVRKVLLSQNIEVYALGVDTAAMPVYDKGGRVRLPGFGSGDVLAKYPSETGGGMFAEFGKEGIEQAYRSITDTARNQYTLGYNTKAPLSSSYRSIDVHVHRPGLSVTAKSGYYPLTPQR